MDNDTMVTLKPCPFCGGEAEFQLDRGRNNIGVGCKKCLCNHVPSWQGSDAQRWAAEAWNHRHQSGRTGAGEALAALREDHRKLALFHASGGNEVSWEEVDAIVAAALREGTDQ